KQVVWASKNCKNRLSPGPAQGGTNGTEIREPPEPPEMSPGGPLSKWDKWDRSTRRARKADPAEEKNWLTAEEGSIQDEWNKWTRNARTGRIARNQYKEPKSNWDARARNTRTARTGRKESNQSESKWDRRATNTRIGRNCPKRSKIKWDIRDKWRRGTRRSRISRGPIRSCHVSSQEKSQKSQWAGFRAPIRTNGIMPRVPARAHKENSKDSPPKSRRERIIQRIRACHVASKWQCAGKYFKIRFRLFRALNLQIDISFDPELGFARS
ncbi:hypothetical protein KI387_006019, partial [Taxus chinensis]